MRHSILAAALMLPATQSLAEGAAPLREALGGLPEMVLSNPAPEQAFFVNIAALDTLTPGQLNRAMLGAFLRPFEAALSTDAESWQEKSGMPLKDIRYFAGFGQAPYEVVLWGLQDEAAAQGLVTALGDRGFTPAKLPGVVGNGEPLADDLAMADPGDPWRSRVGAARFAAAKGDVVISATTPAAMPMLRADGPSAADNPVIGAALDGLSQAVGDGVVVQAMVVSPVMGLVTLDPVDLLLPQAGNLAQVRERLAERVEAGRTGIPPWFGGILADAQLDGPAAILSLSYADCETAETAAQLMETRWQTLMPEPAQGVLTSGTHATNGGLCAATLTVASPGTDAASNPAFDVMLRMHMQRAFAVLNIGEAE